FLCEHSEVGRYATMFFGILDRQGRFEFINAGHPSPLLVRAGEIAEAFTEGGFPVGLIPDAGYVASRVMLEPGDTLVLYSDGVTEATDPDEQMFGISRLRELLLGQHEAPLEVLQKTILESVRVAGSTPRSRRVLSKSRPRQRWQRRGSGHAAGSSWNAVDEAVLR